MDWLHENNHYTFPPMPASHKMLLQGSTHHSWDSVTQMTLKLALLAPSEHNVHVTKASSNTNEKIWKLCVL